MSRRIIFDPQLERTVARARQNVELIQRPSPYAVGAVRYPRPGACGTGGGASQDRHCYKHGRRLCDMVKVGALVQQTGGSAFTLRIEPQRSSYFEPIAVRAVITDASNSSLNYRAFFTAVTINDFPQENVNTVNPTVATTSGWWSDDWQDPDIYAVPVNWGVFSKASLTYPLDIHGFLRGINAGVTVEVSLSIYGNPMDSLGECQLGKPIPEGGNGNGSGVHIPQ